MEKGKVKDLAVDNDSSRLVFNRHQYLVSMYKENEGAIFCVRDFRLSLVKFPEI